MEVEEILALQDVNSIMRIEGERNGSWKFYNQGFFYYRHNRAHNLQYQEYRCIRRNCLGFIRKNLITANLEIRQAHNLHEANFFAFHLARLRIILKQTAANARSSNDLRRVFNEACAR